MEGSIVPVGFKPSFNNDALNRGAVSEGLGGDQASQGLENRDISVTVIGEKRPAAASVQPAKKRLATNNVGLDDKKPGRMQAQETMVQGFSTELIPELCYIAPPLDALDQKLQFPDLEEGGQVLISFKDRPGVKILKQIPVLQNYSGWISFKELAEDEAFVLGALAVDADSFRHVSDKLKNSQFVIKVIETFGDPNFLTLSASLDNKQKAKCIAHVALSEKLSGGFDAVFKELYPSSVCWQESDFLDAFLTELTKEGNREKLSFEKREFILNVIITNFFRSSRNLLKGFLLSNKRWAMESFLLLSKTKESFIKNLSFYLNGMIRILCIHYWGYINQKHINHYKLSLMFLNKAKDQFYKKEKLSCLVNDLLDSCTAAMYFFPSKRGAFICAEQAESVVKKMANCVGDSNDSIAIKLLRYAPKVIQKELKGNLVLAKKYAYIFSHDKCHTIYTDLVKKNFFELGFKQKDQLVRWIFQKTDDQNVSQMRLGFFFELRDKNKGKVWQKELGEILAFQHYIPILEPTHGYDQWRNIAAVPRILRILEASELNTLSTHYRKDKEAYITDILDIWDQLQMMLNSDLFKLISALFILTKIWSTDDYLLHGAGSFEALPVLGFFDQRMEAKFNFFKNKRLAFKALPKHKVSILFAVFSAIYKFKVASIKAELEAGTQSERYFSQSQMGGAKKRLKKLGELEKNQQRYDAFIKENFPDLNTAYESKSEKEKEDLQREIEDQMVKLMLTFNEVKNFFFGNNINSELELSVKRLSFSKLLSSRLVEPIKVPGAKKLGINQDLAELVQKHINPSMKLMKAAQRLDEIVVGALRSS